MDIEKMMKENAEIDAKANELLFQQLAAQMEKELITQGVGIGIQAAFQFFFKLTEKQAQCLLYEVTRERVKQLKDPDTPMHNDIFLNARVLLELANERFINNTIPEDCDLETTRERGLNEVREARKSRTAKSRRMAQKF